MVPELFSEEKLARNGTILVRTLAMSECGALEQRTDGWQIHFPYGVGGFFDDILPHVVLKTPFDRRRKEAYITLLAAKLIWGQTPSDYEEKPVLSFKGTELVGVQEYSEYGNQWRVLRFANQEVVNATFSLLLPLVNLNNGYPETISIRRATKILQVLGMFDEETVNELKSRIPALPRPDLPPNHWENARHPSALLYEVEANLKYKLSAQTR